MKICITCKHHVVDVDVPKTKYTRCGYNRQISLVDGQPVPIDFLPYCASQRIGQATITSCGKEGQYFEENTNV